MLTKYYACFADHSGSQTILYHQEKTVHPSCKIAAPLWSQIWRPLQLKDMKPIESVHHATKFILNDYTSNYSSRLIKLHILPLSMLFELSDICFFLRSLKLISSNISFNILNYISFSQNPTRSKSYTKLVQPLVKNNRDKQFYFNRLPCLWNSLPPIDLSLSFITIRSKLMDIFWKSFITRFTWPCPRCFSQPKSCFFVWPFIKLSILYINFMYHLSCYYNNHQYLS